jgi:predicted RNase H-like HicB family nuclease
MSEPKELIRGVADAEVRTVSIDVPYGQGWRVSVGKVSLTSDSSLASVTVVGPNGGLRTIGIDLDKVILLNPPMDIPTPDRAVVHHVANVMNDVRRSRLLGGSVANTESATQLLLELVRGDESSLGRSVLIRKDRTKGTYTARWMERNVIGQGMTLEQALQELKAVILFQEKIDEEVLAAAEGDQRLGSDSFIEFALNVPINDQWRVTMARIGADLAPIAHVVFQCLDGREHITGIHLDKGILLCPLIHLPNPTPEVMSQIVSRMNEERARSRTYR